VDVALLTSI